MANNLSGDWDRLPAEKRTTNRSSSSAVYLLYLYGILRFDFFNENIKSWPNRWLYILFVLTLRYSAPGGVLGPRLTLLHVVALRRHSRYCAGLGARTGSFSGPLVDITEGSTKSGHGRKERP